MPDGQYSWVTYWGMHGVRGALLFLLWAENQVTPTGRMT